MRVEEPSWSPLSPAITAEELPQALARHPVVVVHIWAIWNGHDRRMDATIQAVRPEYADRIAFYALDVNLESNWPLLRQCHVLSIPAIACFIEGTWLENSIGVRSIEQMHANLQAWLEIASSRQPDEQGSSSGG
ncbi:MAG TPA: thioredoxin family protein [Chthonomonadaceae bacterium]|nr:thioredoxin family protein [Chthonomonadaceae bacterium]